MAKTLIFLLILIILIVFGYWISVNSGELTFSIFGYEVETNVMVGIIFLIVFTLVLFLIMSLFKKLFNIPNALKTYFVERKTLNIIKTQGDLIIEMAARNTPAVKKLSSRLAKLTKDKTLKEVSNVLNNNTAKADTVEASRVLDLIKLDQSIIDDNWLAAHAILEKAWSRNKTKVIMEYLVEVYIKLELWLELEDFVESNTSRMGRAQAIAIRTIARYNIAKASLKGGGGEAGQVMDELIDILKVSPKFHYAFVLLIDIAIKYQIKGRILNTARVYFSKCQNPEVTVAILKLSELFNNDQLYNFSLNLHRDNGESLESKIILAQFSLNAGMHDQAFREISVALSIHGKTARLCLLMAEFCQRTQGSALESIDWIKSAMVANSDNYSEKIYLDLDTMTLTNNITRKILEIKDY